MTQTTSPADTDPVLAKGLDAKHLIDKVQDVLSLILAAAHAITTGDLDDDVGACRGN